MMAEEYARAIARVIVAQMASTYEFEVIQDSALDTLVSFVCAQYQRLGEKAALSADFLT